MARVYGYGIYCIFGSIQDEAFEDSKNGDSEWKFRWGFIS